MVLKIHDGKFEVSRDGIEPFVLFEDRATAREYSGDADKFDSLVATILPEV